MAEDQWYNGLALALAVVLLGGLLLGLALAGVFTGRPSSPGPPAFSGPSFLYLTVTTSAHTNFDTYYPANVSIPHGVPIVITITSYDPGVNPVPAPYGNVLGTAGDLANYTLEPNQSTQVLSTLQSTLISHTFSVTLPGMAGDVLLGAGKPMVNVPVPVSQDGIVPATVTFTVTFAGPGEYAWKCLAPCDPYSMTTPGFMSGSIFVT
jgi:hypothetical protein